MPTVSTVPASPGKSRQEAWREKLQEFASKPPEEMGDEWGLLLKKLGLTYDYYLAVCEVLKQGRWATAKYPRAYVKYAATIEARKMHLSIPHKDDTLEFADSHIEFVGGSGEIDKHEAQLEMDARYEADHRAEMYDEQKPRLPADWWIQQEPDARYLSAVEEFNRSHSEEHIHVRHPRNFDWPRLAREAGLDPLEERVLLYRKQGISRELALYEQPDEQSRKSLQAAWKKMDRTGLKKVQDFLKKKKKKRSQDVPEEQPMNTRKIGACAPPHPRAAISGNPLQSSWKRTGGTSRGDLGRFLIKDRGRGPYQFAAARSVRILDSECPGRAIPRH